jgi:hypothetical protein
MKKYKSLFYLLLVIFLIYLFILYINKDISNININTNYFEYFNSSNINNKYNFMSEIDTIIFFKKDADNYLKNLTELDIKAHKSDTKEEYLNKIINSVSDFTEEEKDKLIKAMKKADNALSKISIPGFNGMKAYNLNWNLALTRGNDYEDGLPHTRMNVIFVSDKILSDSINTLAKIMLHEKVHVYERLYPEDIDIWINSSGYKRFKKWKDITNARSNPDINDWSYISPNGYPMVVLYKNDNPNSIHDAEYPLYNDPSSEHPYEKLAYTLEKYI